MTTRASAKKSPAKPKAKKKGIGTSPDAAKARRLAFAEAYVRNGRNATQAALEVGFSAKSAYSQAGRLMKHAEVRTAIDLRTQELMAADQLTTQTLHDSLRQALLFDPRKLYRADGTLKAVHELDDDTALALTGIEVSEESTTAAGEGKPSLLKVRTAKVAWERKGGARDQLARMLGAYEKDNRQRTDPLVSLLAELGKRPSTLPIAQDNAA